MDTDGLLGVATQYIRANEKRRKAEVAESEVRKVLEELLASEGLAEVTTVKGTVRYQDVLSADYDYQALAPLIPPTLLQLVTRVSVHSRALEDLIAQGSVDPKAIEGAKRVRETRRLVIVPSKRLPRKTRSLGVTATP